MHDRILNRIREAVMTGRYRLTDHALDELDNDHLYYIDAESAILTGTIIRVQPKDERSTERYTIEGFAADLTTKLGVVCRFDETQTLLIITAYQIQQ